MPALAIRNDEETEDSPTSGAPELSSARSIVWLEESPLASVNKMAPIDSLNSCDLEDDPMATNRSNAPVVEDNLLVHLSIRTDRMLVGALFVCLSLLLTVVLLHGGRDVFIHEHGIDEKDRKKTLELYNSRSGAIVSAFHYPIKVTAGVLLSVVILTFGKRFVMVSNPTYETRLGVMVVSFAMAYLLTSGLSSINVKLLDDIPVIHMNADDLVTPTVLHEAMIAPPSGFNNTWSESTPNNSITNTVLRTVVRPYKMRPPPLCSAADSKIQPSPVTATFGFRLATWQSDVFQNAMAADSNASNSFKIYMNQTKQQAVLRQKNFPMNMSVATNLFANSLMFSYSWVKWWSKGINMSQRMETTFSQRFGQRSMADIERKPRSLTATDAFDLTPASDSVDPVDWFVNRTRALLHESLAPHVTASYIASSIEFKSIKLTDDITMDAITYELPMWKGYLNRKLTAKGRTLVSNGLNNSEIDGMTNRTDAWEAAQEARTVYYEINKRDDCGPSVPACIVESREFADGVQIVPEHRIRAIGICLNDEGTEELKFTETIGPIPGSNSDRKTVLRMPSCKGKSETSFHISGFSYRIVGDAMLDSPAPGVDKDEDPAATRQRAVLVNPRKVYTFTIARISWKTVDLAHRFNVHCDNSTDCQGLSVPLDPEPGMPPRHVVIGQRRLPIAELQPYAYAEPYYHVQFVAGVPLVATPIMLNVKDSVFADYALSHNFRTVQWPNSSMKGNNCSRFIEKVLVSNVDNHYYIEGTVQPVYTTALFFLFQHGAAREELKDFRLSHPLLKTEHVVVPVSVLVSIPDKNAIVSIIASILLFLACAGVWFQHRRRPDGLQQALPANTTVQVLMNNGTFPPFLLRKTVMTRDQGRVIGEGKGVQIDRAGLRAQKKSSEV